MARATVHLSIDTAGFEDLLASLSELAERFPEFHHGIVSLLEAGEELFLFNGDDISASAGELVMRFYPSDGLLRLVTALRARHPDLLLFEHFPLPSGKLDQSTSAFESR